MSGSPTPVTCLPPGGIDVMVMRSLESTRPAPIVNLRNARGSRGAAGARKPRTRRATGDAG